MTINWKEFISQDYWFGVDRVMMHRTDSIILAAGILMVAGAIALIAYTLMSNNPFLKKVAKELSAVLATIGILEIVWYGLRSQYVVALGTRFAALIVLVFGIAWAYFPVKYLLKRYKTDVAAADAQYRKDKYLSRPAK